MKLISEILIAGVALLHIYILWLEMFAWTTRGRKAFKSILPDLFEKTKALAANQGLYSVWPKTPFSSLCQKKIIAHLPQ